MKPKVYEYEFLSDEDLKEGALFLITEEFAPNPKFPKVLIIGKVELENGEVKLLSLNKSSYFEIAKTLGDDTENWVDKYIVYLGIKEFGPMKVKGRLFGGSLKKV